MQKIVNSPDYHSNSFLQITMNAQISKLQTQNANALDSMQTTVLRAMAKGRQLNEAEQAQVAEHEAQIKQNAADIQVLLEQRKFEDDRRANPPVNSFHIGRGAGRQKHYDPLNTMRAALDKRPVNGLEGELHAEWGVPTQSQNGKHIIPWQAFGHWRKEGNYWNLTYGTATEGSELVPTRTQTPPVMPLWANLASNELGVRRIMGLNGDLEFPVLSRNNASAAWLAETASTSELEPATSEVKVAPHRIGGHSKVSNLLLTTTGSFDARNWLQSFLRMTIAENMENVFWNGTGQGQVPKGLIPTLQAGQTISSVAANGDPISRKKTLGAFQLVANANAMTSQNGWAINPNIDTVARQINLDTGSGRWLLEGNLLDEHRFASSTLLPSNGTKGTSSQNLNTIVFGGNWSEAVITMWNSGVQVLVDPYSNAKTSEVLVHAEAHMDVAVLRESSFVKLVELKSTVV